MTYGLKYQQRKAEHLCVRCGEQDERTLSGKILCVRCEGLRREEQKRSDHRCVVCGEDISDRGPTAQYCLSCYHEKDLERKRVQKRGDPMVIKRHRQKKPDGLSLEECAVIARKAGLSYGQAQAKGLFR